MSGRRRRRRGPGSRRPGGRSGPRRTIIITSVSPTGQVKSSSPTIRAYVEDMYGSLLSGYDIDVYLDGQELRFDYNPSTGRLICSTWLLPSGTHTVEIVATIESNYGSRTGRKRWTFNVKK
ncbi:MAG: hypothetical protein ACRDTR_20980 [Rubrobacter sp.]